MDNLAVPMFTSLDVDTLADSPVYIGPLSQQGPSSVSSQLSALEHAIQASDPQYLHLYNNLKRSGEAYYSRLHM